jgi:DNA-binding PadR family transcriptional regulator
MYSVVGYMPKSIPSLAEFELYVMLALARLEDEGYGAAAKREIEERTGRSVSIGAVYATLGRLEDKGLLWHLVSAPTPVQGGRARKLYHLTDLGQEAVQQATFRLERMMDGLVTESGTGTRR